MTFLASFFPASLHSSHLLSVSSLCHCHSPSLCTYIHMYIQHMYIYVQYMSPSPPRLFLFASPLPISHPPPSSSLSLPPSPLSLAPANMHAQFWSQQWWSARACYWVIQWQDQCLTGEVIFNFSVHVVDIVQVSPYSAESSLYKKRGVMKTNNCASVFSKRVYNINTPSICIFWRIGIALLQASGS